MHNQLILKPAKYETILTRFADSIEEKTSPIGNKFENKYQGQFTQIPFGLFRDKEMYTKLCDCLPIYMYLQTCVYRGKHSKDKFNLYDDYFLHGVLVASVTKDEIGKAHGGLCFDTVTKRLNLLIEYGFIEVKEIKTKYRKGKKLITGHQKLYFLGTHVMGKPKYKACNNTFISDDV